MKQILNDEQKVAVKKIIGNYTYGDLVPNELLHDLLGMPDSDKRVTIKQARKEAFSYLSKIEGVKDYLLEKHKYMLVSSRGVGYLIIKPSEQVQHAVRDYFKAAEKSAEKCRSRLKHVNTELLSPEERVRDSETKSAFARLEAGMNHDRTSMAKMLAQS